MKAGDIMTTGAATVHPWQTIVEAARSMIAHRISGLPVVDTEGVVVGMLTEGDLLRRVEIGTEHPRPRWLDLWLESGVLAEEFTRSHGRRVEDVMTRNVVTIDAEMPLNDVVDIMEQEHVKRLPVLKVGMLVGIISRADILLALTRRMEAPMAALHDDLKLRGRIVETIRRSLWAEGTKLDVDVRDGVATLRGTVVDERVERAVRIAAETTPGVRQVVCALEHATPVSRNA